MLKSGILLIDKPEGLTSHDVVNIVRRKFSVKKAGHAGTLDPLATGLLVVLVGSATKQFNRFAGFDKEYLATIKFGEATDSGDSLGKVIESLDYTKITEQQVRDVLKRLEGQIENVPPMMSAVKYQGKPLYKLARRGISIPRQGRLVTIQRLELLKFYLPFIDIDLKCSKGTYVRSLAEDIAKNLSCVGHVCKIRRSVIGRYSVRDAKKIDEFDEFDIRPC